MITISMAARASVAHTAAAAPCSLRTSIIGTRAI